MTCEHFLQARKTLEESLENDTYLQMRVQSLRVEMHQKSPYSVYRQAFVDSGIVF